MSLNKNDVTVKSNALVLQTQKISSPDEIQGCEYRRVYYISDIHLENRFKNTKCKSKKEEILKIVSTISEEAGSLLLIGGDVSSKFSTFELFVRLLEKELNGRTTVVFILGNHELWDFPEASFENIEFKYRKLIESCGMYLLQNDLLYQDSNGKINMISYDKLCSQDEATLKEQLQDAKFAILGSLAFTGNNKTFNADNGLYLSTVITRSIDKKETAKFVNLYNKLYPVIKEKNTIIFTHTPEEDWCSDIKYDENFIYVNGHTHKDYFYDNGKRRIYADNQIDTSKHNNPHLKSLLIDYKYDYFINYPDGIYEITGQQYSDFYRWKNISMTVTRKSNILYMLKKNDFYCFIHKAKNGSFTILCGGERTKLNITDIQFYYDNMDVIISNIQTQLKPFTDFQESIANEIKKIGGKGRIHGTIIDIDFNNHVNINPLDMTVTSYRVSETSVQENYPSISSLLKRHRHDLYKNYAKLIKDDKNNPLMTKMNIDNSFLSQLNLGTDISTVSRKINKIQKLNANILCFWLDDIITKGSQAES